MTIHSRLTFARSLAAPVGTLREAWTVPASRAVGAAPAPGRGKVEGSRVEALALQMPGKPALLAVQDGPKG
jgi:hypothetical protein